MTSNLIRQWKRREAAKRWNQSDAGRDAKREYKRRQRKVAVRRADFDGSFLTDTRSSGTRSSEPPEQS
jgi:hypothetical protein